MFQKILLAALIVSAAAGEQASADTYVRGHTRSNGTYVAPHYRSNPDHSFSNNWSTSPNVNPYTGQTGTRHTPSYSPRTPTFSPGGSYPGYGLPSLPSPSYGLPSPSSSFPYPR